MEITLENAFTVMLECLKSNRTVFVGGCGPFRVNAVDDVAKNIRLTKYKYTKQYLALKNLVKETKDGYNDTGIVLYIKNQIDKYGDLWYLEYVYDLCVTAPFFNDNHVVLMPWQE